MNKTEFNTLLKSCTVRAKGNATIKPEKARALSTDARLGMTRYIVRKRQALLLDLLPDDPDVSWLAACGYMYRTTSPTSNLRFLHTCEHVIR